MNHPRRFALLLTLCFVLTGRGEGGSRWEHLEVGMSEAEASSALGSPLIVNGSRGFVQWTFDAGGSAMFQQGVLLFWGMPPGYRPAPAKPAPAVVVIETPDPVETGPAPASVRNSLMEFYSPQTPPLHRPKSDLRVPSFDELRQS